VVTGIGFPTLVPNGGVNALMVDDVDGVKISNLLFDAGTVNSPALVTIGTTGSHVNHAANPTSVQDVFFRIGGAVAGISTTSLLLQCQSNHPGRPRVRSSRGSRRAISQPADGTPGRRHD
jgi:hypothetical protein